MLVRRLLPQARERHVTIGIDAPLLEAARLLHGTRTELVVVCDPAERLAGVVTKTDVVRQIGRCLGASCTAPASAVMTRDVALCRPDDWLNDVWSLMKERGLKNIPIADEASRPLGILNARDALELLVEEVEHEERLLRDYVMCVGYR